MLTLYAETVFDPKLSSIPAQPRFQVPRKNGSYNKSKLSQATQKRLSLAKDEALFQAEHLATSSSFYFRHTKHYPRSFFWRIVGNERTLEIQPADLSRPDKIQHEAHFTLAFEFQDSILPLGIGFADSAKSDSLHVFVCTNNNEIFDLCLTTELFRSAGSKYENVGDFCEPVDVSSLTIDNVYQLHVSNPNELFVAFATGRVQRIFRRAEKEVWNQDNYDDSTWTTTIRGIVGRRGMQRIDHGSTRLALHTVQGMVASQDTMYLYTLCLNHTLRIWQLSTGKLVETRDLLDVEREPNERLQLNPAEPGLIRLVTFPKRASQTLITYTPHEGGQFKFWDIRGGLTGDLEIKDRFPQVKLNPPDPDPSGNTIWSLTSFEVVPGKKDGTAQIWLLWRNNNFHQVYTMHFDDLLNVPEAWQDQWVIVEQSQKVTHGPDLIVSDPSDTVQKWLEFLFYPGRYSNSVLETALARYQEITGATLQTKQQVKTIQERLCLVVASSVNLRKYDNADLDYERFNLDTDHQWRSFWRVLETINEQRYAPLALAFDPYLTMAWVCMADTCAAIRECNRIELMQHNDVTVLTNSDDLIAARWPHRKVVDDVPVLEGMATILQAADKFRQSFSPELANEFFGAVEEEIYTEPEMSTPERIVLIFNQVGFSEGLSQGAEQQLLKDLEPLGGVGGLNNALVLSILKAIAQSPNKRHKSSLMSTRFGAKFLSAALLEDIEMTKAILLGLLGLIVFIDESDDFDPPELFDQIIFSLREQQRNLWLSTHFRQSSTKSTSDEPRSFTSPLASQQPVSIMEDIFVRNFRPLTTDTRSLMYLIPETISEIQKWACGSDAVNYDDATVHILCDLLVNENVDLATKFLKFQPSGAWPNYVKGRLRLSKAEYEEALTYFGKAAYTLSSGKAIGNMKEMSAGLLSVIDAEHFNNGSSRYWQHIMELFDSKQSYPQVAEAARIALQGLQSSNSHSISGFRSELLSRLFTAELKCARFEAAFDTLIQFSDHALQKTSSVALANAILDRKLSASNAAGTLELLQKLPWSLHPRIALYLDQHLSLLSQKQTTTPNSSSQWNHASNTDYLSILYALRLRQNDYRGATSILFDRLRILQRSGRVRGDPEATSLRQTLLTLINTMTNVAPEEAFLLVDTRDDPRLHGSKRFQQQEQQGQPRKRMRTIITLADLRKEYQQVLDRCSRIERGDFDFEDGEVTDDEQDPNINANTASTDAMEI